MKVIKIIIVCDFYLPNQVVKLHKQFYLELKSQTLQLPILFRIETPKESLKISIYICTKHR